MGQTATTSRYHALILVATELVGPPGKCVHRDNSQYAFGQLGGTGAPRQSTQIVNDQHNVLEIQLSDHRGTGTRSPLQTDVAHRHAVSDSHGGRGHSSQLAASPLLISFMPIQAPLVRNPRT
jgi:hypothetical protein